MGHKTQQNRTETIKAAGKVAGMKAAKVHYDNPCHQDAQKGYTHPLRALSQCMGAIRVAEHDYNRSAKKYADTTK